jgi:predicted TIM-barrel fold metal-dependent hydrolase
MSTLEASPAAGVLRTHWMISSDSHVIEPPGLWQERTDTDLRDRAPRVVSEQDGDWWYVDGYKTMSFLGIQTGVRFDGTPEKLRTSATFEEVRPASQDPAAYLRENERDGIWASVLYPSQGLVIFGVPVHDVVSASMRAYNDWLAEFCSHDTGRLKGIAMVNVDDPDEGAAELVRCRALGLCGALVTVAPPVRMPFRSAAYERFWSTAEDLDVPLSLHVGTDRADPEIGREAFRLDVKNVPPSAFVNKDYQVRQAFADLILSGVFERHPRLRVGTVEHELAWIPFFLDQLDYAYTDRPARGPEWRRFDDSSALPSDFFRRQAFASFQEDGVGLRVRDHIGVHTLMWGSDYPHTESTFPRSQEIVAEIFAGISADDLHRVVSANAAELYHFDVPARSA